MTFARTAGFFAVLTLAVSAAVGPLAAQDRAPRPGRPVMMLDGFGVRLGVMVKDLDGDALAAAKGTGGVLVDKVSEHSAAQKAGLKPGDILVDYDGERVRSVRQFRRLVEETPEGRTVKIGLLRNGQRQTLDAAPEAGPFAMGVDTDEIRQGVERGMRDLGRLREVPGMPPALNFRDPERAPPQRGRLGVTVTGLSPQLAGYFGAKGGGVLVSEVATGSPAEKAGIKAGDVITTVNGRPVEDARDVTEELASATGAEVRIGILRDKKDSAVTAVIERPRTPGASARPARPGRSARPA